MSVILVGQSILLVQHFVEFIVEDTPTVTSDGVELSSAETWRVPGCCWKLVALKLIVDDGK